ATKPSQSAAPPKFRPSAPPIGGSPSPQASTMSSQESPKPQSEEAPVKAEVVGSGTVVMEPLSTDWSAAPVGQGTTTVIMVDNYPGPRAQPTSQPPPRTSSSSPPAPTAQTPGVPLELPKNETAGSTQSPLARTTSERPPA